jgi:hypothetical protein
MVKMSRLLEFFLGSILITVFTVALLFFSAIHYILGASHVTDCTWYASARTWIDDNGDGRVNPGESPLSDVKIHVTDLQHQLTSVSWPAVTDQDGDVQLSMSIPGCADTIFEIYVDIPEGYRITTRPRLAVRPDIWESSSTEPVYYFGFAPEH